jgi:hypothetical protein
MDFHPEAVGKQVSCRQNQTAQQERREWIHVESFDKSGDAAEHKQVNEEDREVKYPKESGPFYPNGTVFDKKGEEDEHGKPTKNITNQADGRHTECGAQAGHFNALRPQSEQEDDESAEKQLIDRFGQIPISCDKSSPSQNEMDTL